MECLKASGGLELHAVLVAGVHTMDGEILAGQTWDLNPQDIDYVVGIHRKPEEAPETWSITVSGCPSLVGMNADGIAVGTTNINADVTSVGGALSLTFNSGALTLAAGVGLQGISG